MSFNSRYGMVTIGPLIRQQSGPVLPAPRTGTGLNRCLLSLLFTLRKA